MTKIVNKSEIDDWMRMNALKFLENVSFDEIYIRESESYQKDKKNIDAKNKLIGLIRSIK